MTEVPEQRPDSRFAIRRILAAFGPATMSVGVLEGAADLAIRLGAELKTLFVEDIALLQWTELPFIRHASLHGLTARPLSQGELELQFRALASEAQRRLSAIATHQELRWSFRVARGQVSGEVIAGAAHNDLLVLGSSTRPLAREMLLESSVRPLIGAVKAPVLLLPSAQPPHGPIHVVLEPQDETERLLEAAIAMTCSSRDNATITAWKPEAGLEGKPSGVFAAAAAGVRVRSFSSVQDIETLMGSIACGTLVLSASSRLLGLNDWWRDFARARCALLLVR